MSAARRIRRSTWVRFRAESQTFRSSRFPALVEQRRRSQIAPGVASEERAVLAEILSHRDKMKFEPPQAEKPSEINCGFRETDFEQERIPQFRYELYPRLMNVILESEVGTSFSAR